MRTVLSCYTKYKPGKSCDTLTVYWRLFPSAHIGRAGFRAGQTRPHSTAQKLTDLGVDTSAVVQEDDVGYINQILASEADDATMKAKIMKLLEED